jgi:hypothetical protein
MEVMEVPYTWKVRIVANSASDPDQQDIAAVAWEAIFNEWATYDAICCGGNAQLSYPRSVEPFDLENDGVLYVGIEITFTVIVKKARVFV